MYFVCVATFLCLPCVSLYSLKLGCLTTLFYEVFVCHKFPSFVVGGDTGVHHGSCLRIVLGRVQVEIQKVVCCVLSYSQIPRARTLFATHVSLGFIHITFSIFTFSIGLILSSHLFLDAPLHFF